MTNRDDNSPTTRGELLVGLRYGLRQSIRLAEQLSSDPIIGAEARGMLSRLDTIRHELEGISAGGLNFRRADHDPLWSEFLSRASTIQPGTG